MTKESEIKLKMSLKSAATVRQILFEHQDGYSYDYAPERILNIREIILEIDSQLENAINKK